MRMIVFIQHYTALLTFPPRQELARQLLYAINFCLFYFSSVLSFHFYAINSLWKAVERTIAPSAARITRAVFAHCLWGVAQRLYDLSTSSLYDSWLCFRWMTYFLLCANRLRGKIAVSWRTLLSPNGAMGVISDRRPGGEKAAHYGKRAH